MKAVLQLNMCTREIISLPWRWEGGKGCTYRSMKRKKSFKVLWAHIVLVQRHTLLCLRRLPTHMHGAYAVSDVSLFFSIHVLWLTHHPAIMMFECTSVCHGSLTKGHWNRFGLNESSLWTRQSNLGNLECYIMSPCTSRMQIEAEEPSVSLQ